MTGWEQAISTGGPWALVGFAVLAIFTGKLSPKSYVDDLRQELAYERQRSREMEATIRDLVTEASRLTVALTAAAVPHPPQGLSTASAGTETVA